jgi:hypothetical protein
MIMGYKEQTIIELQEKLSLVEQEANKIKRAVNLLCELDGKPPMYSDFDKMSEANTQLKGDEYHNMPQATAITAVMERRKSANIAPVTIEEIFGDLIAGGFQFTKGKNEGIQKRGLAISMSKNRKFYKLPNEKWGIKSWYNIKDTKETTHNINGNDDSENNEEQ